MTAQGVVGRLVKISDRVAVKYYLVRTNNNDQARQATAHLLLPFSQVEILRIEGGELIDMMPNEIKETNVAS